jgi:hypothetical protein
VREAPVRAAPKQAKDEDTFDPLGAFLQELDSPEPAEPVKQAAPPQAKADPVSDLFDDDDDQDDEDDDLDEFDLDIFDDPAFDELAESKASDPLGLDDNEDDEEEELEDFAAPPPPPTQQKPVQQKAAPVEPPRQREPEQRPRPPQEVRPPQPPRQQTVLRTEPPRKPEPPKPEARDAERAVREQPRQPEPPRKPQQPQQAAPQAGQGGFKPKLGNQPQRHEIKQPKAPEQPVREQPVREKPPQPAQQSMANFKGAGEAREQHNPRPTPPPPPQRNEPRREQQQVARAEATKHEPRHAGRHEHHEHRDAPAPEASTGNGPRMGKMKPGRLFGWLVSYESPDGRAIELRAGRFFITATSIRGTDLILEDQSISTPHALVSINERGLLLQDLMSERGTFVRAKGEAQYRREEGIIEVQHGDWVRFGDVEFLVTIVPG